MDVWPSEGIQIDSQARGYKQRQTATEERTLVPTVSREKVHRQMTRWEHADIMTYRQMTTYIPQMLFGYTRTYRKTTTCRLDIGLHRRSRAETETDRQLHEDLQTDINVCWRVT